MNNIVDQLIENKTSDGKKVTNYIARIYGGDYTESYVVEGRGLTPGEAIDECLRGKYFSYIYY